MMDQRSRVRGALRGMTRRDLLASGVAAGASFFVGQGYVAHATEAWAVELRGLQPATMVTLVQMARDIYPHDRLRRRPLRRRREGP